MRKKNIRTLRMRWTRRSQNYPGSKCGKTGGRQHGAWIGVYEVSAGGCPGWFHTLCSPSVAVPHASCGLTWLTAEMRPHNNNHYHHHHPSPPPGPPCYINVRCVKFSPDSGSVANAPGPGWLAGLLLQEGGLSLYWLGLLVVPLAEAGLDSRLSLSCSVAVCKGE